MWVVALGLLLSTANVFPRCDATRRRGVQYLVLPDPYLYPSSMVPETFRPILAWNPLTPILTLYRQLILSPQQVEWSQALYPCLLGLVLLGVGQWVFQRCKGYFADYL